MCVHAHEAVHAPQGKVAGSISSAPFIPQPETFVFKFHYIVKNLVSTSQNQLLFLPLFEIAKQNSVYFNS